MLENLWNCKQSFGTVLKPIPLSYGKGVGHILRVPNMAKDVGFVVPTLRHCENQEELSKHQLSQLEGVMVNADCIKEKVLTLIKRFHSAHNEYMY